MKLKPFAAICKNNKAIKINNDIYSSLVQTGSFSSYISKVKRSLHFLLFTVRDFFGPGILLSECFLSASLMSVLLSSPWRALLFLLIPSAKKNLYCRKRLLVSNYVLDLSPPSLSVSLSWFLHSVTWSVLSPCLSLPVLLLLRLKLKGLSQMSCLSYRQAHLSFQTLLEALLLYLSFFIPISWYCTEHICVSLSLSLSVCTAVIRRLYTLIMAMNIMVNLGF